MNLEFAKLLLHQQGLWFMVHWSPLPLILQICGSKLCLYSALRYQIIGYVRWLGNWEFRLKESKKDPEINTLWHFWLQNQGFVIIQNEVWQCALTTDLLLNISRHCGSRAENIWIAFLIFSYKYKVYGKYFPGKMCNSALSLWQIWFFGGISNSGGSLPKYRSNFTKLVPSFQWGKGDDHDDHDASTCTCTCRVGLTAPSSSSKVLPVVFLLPLVYYLRKHLSLSISDWFWGVSNFFWLTM